ncbi:hypothetical protein ACFOUP_15785 [Belliella kenyensis]|uniref:Cytochrome C n=1 Tax=Belliella kenyensis TaxID=1472724 RepID=A0ABV8ENK6_9BACT|nr:hypothetical protein [Belliella kenyensis]MCH7401981.1 hypothetical protein [Belliella kenyensis]MDN3605145.1 hypothetical protein [Belliella kenyensis]
MLKSFPAIVFCLILIFACSKKEKNENESETKRYPNQDAPLALLMREMFEDMEKIKIAVAEGEEIKSYIEKHKQLLTATPTDAAVKTEQFNSMAMAYLANLKQLEQSNESNQLENYKSLVSTCLACHSNYCPGPIKRINLLKLD